MINGKCLKRISFEVEKRLAFKYSLNKVSKYHGCSCIDGSFIKINSPKMETTEENPLSSRNLFTQTSDGSINSSLHHEVKLSPQNESNRPLLNLSAGYPGPDLLSKLPQIFKEATNHRMNVEENDNSYLFQYGPLAGLWGMRNALSIFLSENYHHPVNRSNLILTCGATHGLHLVLSILISTDAVIFVDEYTYMLALNILKEFPHHKLIEVPITSNGVDVEKLESIIAEVKKSSTWNTSEDKPFWAMYYTIPNFHNPTGTLLPPSSCQSIVKIARTYDILVVCDDVYNFLHYGSGTPPPRLFAYDSPEIVVPPYAGGHIISNGSFSKILAPGVRVGWMEMPQRLVPRFKQSGIMQSGGSVNNVMFGLMQSILELGLADKHLAWYKQIYMERMQVFCSSLKQHLPSNCHFHLPQGGYFVWVQIPVDASDFLAWCKDNSNLQTYPAVKFMPHGQFCQDKDKFKALRLSIGFYNVETLAEAAKILGENMKEYLRQNGLS